MTYEYYKDHKGEWRWHLVVVNGCRLADSAEGYENESECKKDIDRVKDSADAPVVKKLASARSESSKSFARSEQAFDSATLDQPLQKISA